MVEAVVDFEYPNIFLPRDSKFQIVNKLCLNGVDSDSIQILQISHKMTPLSKKKGSFCEE